MSIPILKIELWLVFLVYPISVVFVPILACCTTKIDGTSLWVLSFANALLCYGIVRTMDSPNDRMGIGVLIGAAAVLCFVVFTMIGVAIAFFKRRDIAASTRFGRAFFAIILGGFVPPLLLFWIGIFNRWPGAFVFAFIGVLLLASGIQAVLNLPIPGEKFRSSHLRQTCLALMISLGAIGCIGLISAFNIRDKADQAAAGRPYCLEPTSDFLNLSIITLRERSYRNGHYLRNHGLLVVDGENGRELFNWSYRENAFQPFDTKNMTESSRPTIRCQPS